MTEVGGAVAEWESVEELEEQILKAALSFLGESAPDDEADKIDINTPLLETGMDSMALSQFKGMLMSDYGLKMTDEEMFDEGRNI